MMAAEILLQHVLLVDGPWEKLFSLGIFMTELLKYAERVVTTSNLTMLMLCIVILEIILDGYNNEMIGLRKKLLNSCNFSYRTIKIRHQVVRVSTHHPWKY